MKVETKFEVEEDGTVRYKRTNSRICVEITQSNEEGVIWCQNCYDDNKPILTVSLDGIDCLNFCFDCLQFFFNVSEERK